MHGCESVSSDRVRRRGLTPPSNRPDSQTLSTSRTSMSEGGRYPQYMRTCGPVVDAVTVDEADGEVCSARSSYMYRGTFVESNR